MLTMRSALERAQRLYGANTAIIDCGMPFHVVRTYGPGDAACGGVAGKRHRQGGPVRDHSAEIPGDIANCCTPVIGTARSPVPVNYRLAPPEIRYILDDADVSQLFIEDTFLSLLESAEFAPWSETAICIPGGPETDTKLRTSDALVAASAAERWP